MPEAPESRRALKSGEFPPIAETGRDNIEQFGMRFISALNVSYPERLAQRPGGAGEIGGQRARLADQGARIGQGGARAVEQPG